MRHIAESAQQRSGVSPSVRPSPNTGETDAFVVGGSARRSRHTFRPFRPKADTLITSTRNRQSGTQQTNNISDADASSATGINFHVLMDNANFTNFKNSLNS